MVQKYIRRINTNSARSALIVLMLFQLVACAVSSGIQPEMESGYESAGMQRFPEWKLANNDVNTTRAVVELLDQADRMIADGNFGQATDKLERLIRIDPASAQAWSRLSWIALQKGMRKRTLQLAQKSNLYASTNRGLQRLNWEFIRDAAELAGEAATVQKARDMILNLENN